MIWIQNENGRIRIGTHCRECGSYGSCSDYGDGRYMLPLRVEVWDHQDYVSITDARGERVGDFPNAEVANTFILLCTQMDGTRGAEL